MEGLRPATDLFVVNLFSPPENNNFIAPFIPYKVSIVMAIK